MKLSGWLWGRKPAFIAPVGIPARVGVVHSRLKVRSPGRVFDPLARDLGERLRRFRPDALAAPYAVLMELSGQVEVERYVVALSEAGGCRLGTDDRERLWERYQVPVFEQLLSSEGELLATECEAHLGLHLVAPALPFPVADLIDGLCACGKQAERPAAVFPVTRTCAGDDGEGLWDAHSAI